MFLVLLSILCLLIPIYVIYKPPSAVIHYFQRRWPDVLFHHATAKKVVALTIDDAPSSYTNEILRILEANDATATFFVIGSQVPGHQQALAALVGAGNELGNHAMHDEPSRALSNAVLEQQIRDVHAMIQDIYQSTGKGSPENWLFRPGSGFFSSRMRSLVAQLGYRLVLGDVFPFDPQVPFPRLNAHHILSMVKPGSIIICHDRRSWTMPMLKIVLPELRRRGYHVVTVSGLLRETT